MRALLRLLPLCLCLLPAIAHASRHDELENLRRRIADLQQELEKTSESKSEAADALRESERAISDSNRKLAELAGQQKEAQQTLKELRTQGQHLNQDLQSQQTLLEKLLYQQYLSGRQEYLVMLLNNRDPNRLAREMQYYEYIAKSRAAQLNVLRTDLDQVHTVAEETRQKSAEIAALQAKQNAQKRALEKERLARSRVLKKIALQLKAQRREIGHLQRNENRLSKLVERLSHLLVRGQGKAAFKNEALPDDHFDGSPFEELKGKLALPVKGVVGNRFGATRSGSLTWKGLLLRAPTNTPVKAVAAGRVVFADWLRGFGNLLIVDHGKGYMSLYGNNETLYKQVGDELHGGDVVASVGSSGGNEDSGLYFELRHEGQPIDPMKWIAR